MMTFDEKIAYSDKLIAKFKSNELYDDLRQEIAVEMLVNPDADVQTIVKCVCKKVLGDEAKHQRARAPHLYNDDGECVDDDVYYVDQSTVEQGEVRESPVTDEMREKVAEIVKTKRYISALYCTRKHHKTSDVAADIKTFCTKNFLHSIYRTGRMITDLKICYINGVLYYENKRNQRIALQTN
jgi:hypothetical protein